MLKYITNSCYNDTLLTILFKSLSSYWRNGILTETYTAGDFRTLRCKNVIKSPPEVLDYSNRIKNELVLIYANLMKGNDITCSTIRPIFNECLGDLIVDGKWVTYSPDIIYGLLTDLYPGILLTSKYEYEKSLNSQKVPLFTMWEYMEISSVKNIRWDILDDEVLVFHNSGLPPISNYDTIGAEKNTITYDHTQVISEIFKDQAFSEFIINDKYILIGVITLQGYKLGQEGGAHYVGYYRNREGNWIYYDDTKNSEQSIDKLPEMGVWKYINYNIPYMYFYQRSDTIKNEILNTITKIKYQKIKYQELNIPTMSGIGYLQMPIISNTFVAPSIPLTPSTPLIPSAPSVPSFVAPQLPTFSQTLQIQQIFQPPQIQIPQPQQIQQPQQLPFIFSTQLPPPQIQPPQLPFIFSTQLSEKTTSTLPSPKTLESIISPVTSTSLYQSNVSIVPKTSVLSENLPTTPLPTVYIEKPQYIQSQRNINVIPGIIKLPTGSTIVPQPSEQIISIKPYEALSYKYDIGHNRAEILARIDPKKLLKGKKSSKNDGYRLDELQSFARLLGIRVNQNKDDLIDAINEMKFLQTGTI